MINKRLNWEIKIQLRYKSRDKPLNHNITLNNECITKIII